MPSPFPGMNPYLEQEDAWHDFHERFMPLAAELLNAQVGPDYIVKIDEHLFIHELPQQPRSFVGRGDVTVSETRPGDRTGTAAATVEAPAEVGLPQVDVEGQSFLEIRDRRNRQLIAVLELLSPSNKNPGPDREQYLHKRNRLLRSSAHLVELDLLRGGPRLPLEGLPPCDYYALVSRAERRPRAGVWPVRLRERLPVVPVPLRAGDADLRLDLQEVLHRIHDAAGYAKFIYDSEPAPPLAADEQAWARQFLPAQAPPVG
jgi:hypothetical protein